MILKSFKEFIKENYRTSLIKKDIIRGSVEINFYFEKLDKIDLESYMATFNNHEVIKFLTNDFYDKPSYLRFFLYYHENYYYMFVFHGDILHHDFALMLDNSKTKYTTIDNYIKLYNYANKGIIDKSIDIKEQWCLPGIYSREVVKSWACNKYMQLLTVLKIYENLGYDEYTWFF